MKTSHSRRAFITGSRAYGTPTKDSDVDIVILADSDAESLLWNLSESSDKILLGRANIIACETEERFDLWKRGTDELIARRPVTRSEAIEHFTRIGMPRDSGSG